MLPNLPPISVLLSLPVRSAKPMTAMQMVAKCVATEHRVPTPPIKLEDIQPTAERLGIIGEIPKPMYRRLARWQQASCPERPAEEVERLTLLPCEHRKPSGLCLKCGCGASAGKTIYCLWLATMGTEKCKAGKW